MARLAPIEARKQGQSIPVLTSARTLTSFMRRARAYIAQRRARILLAFVSLQTLLLRVVDSATASPRGFVAVVRKWSTAKP